LKIAIWGAGAVGLGLASALARANESLRILGRDSETLSDVQTHGIHRTGLFGARHVPPEQLAIESSPRTLAEDPPDWLLVCTKAYSSAEIARTLEPVARESMTRTQLLLCQNGWGNEIPFLHFWPPERLFHARIITGFHRRSPHEVEITAHASPIALGNIFGITDRSGKSSHWRSLERLARRFSQGGIPTETAEDMRGVLWAKMLYNCALNPLGAIAGRSYGELVDEPTTRTLVEEVIREIFLVLTAAGVDVVWPDAASYLETFYSQLIPATAAHESSMLQDLRAVTPPQIDALCGADQRLGSEHNVATPIVSALATLVHIAESRRPTGS
jgi:2-dehydropantoate 2-reductase